MAIRWFTAACAVAAGLDALSKAWALVSLPPWNTPDDAPGVVRLAVAFNESGPGGSLPADFVFPVLSSVLLGYLIVAGARTAPADRPRATALGLAAGGTLGNLANHLMVGGGVIDFLGVRIGADRWLILNVADVMITCGLAVYLALAWKRDRGAPWWRRGMAELA